MYIVCSDMEGVFTPEIWINVAERTGVEELRLTTRDIADYDVLMRHRLSILDEHGITLNDITDVIDTMAPLEGAVAFLDWLRDRVELIVVSDTYTQFAAPLIRKLGRPTLFCHTLSVNGDGRITGYNLRQSDAKRHTVEALKSLNYKVIGMGDSYNDVNMLKAADHGILFRPPRNVIAEFPQFPVTTDYDDLKPIIEDILGNDP
jgi:phosphoserine/homoserine phosphotransferase